jgi:hypothetical protein
VRAARPIGLAAVLAVTACAPDPKAVGIDDETLDAEIGRRLGSAGTCVAVASEGRVVYTWGNYVTCARRAPTCSGSDTSSVEAAALAGEPRRISCPAGELISSWWVADGRTSRGPVTVAVNMAGEDALPGIEIERRARTGFERAGVTFDPAE